MVNLFYNMHYIGLHDQLAPTVHKPNSAIFLKKMKHSIQNFEKITISSTVFICVNMEYMLKI